MQGLVSPAKNAGVMDENVLTLILGDKTEAPSVVEPFNLATGHNTNPSMIQRRGCQWFRYLTRSGTTMPVLLNSNSPTLGVPRWLLGDARVSYGQGQELL